MLTVPTETVPIRLVVTTTSAAAFGVIVPKPTVAKLVVTLKVAVPVWVAEPIDVVRPLPVTVTSALAAIVAILPKDIVAWIPSKFTGWSV